jgi:hypothetical protein
MVCHQSIIGFSSIINMCWLDSSSRWEGHACRSVWNFLPNQEIRIAMNEYKYEIKVKSDGYWVGYRDKNGEWQNADNEPYDSFIDAVKYRDFIEERKGGPVSKAG